MPPDKCNQNPFFDFKDLDIKALNNTYENGEAIRFDSDSASLYVDSCVTGGLTGFKQDFIEGTCVDVEERTSDTTAGKHQSLVKA